MRIVTRSISWIILVHNTLVNGGYFHDSKGTILRESKRNGHREIAKRNIFQPEENHPPDHILSLTSSTDEAKLAPIISHAKSPRLDDIVRDAIDVCRCNVTNECIGKERIKHEDELFLCLQTTTDGETLMEVTSLSFSQGDFVVEAIQEDYMNKFTWVLEGPYVWTVRSRLESSFFKPTFRAKPRENIEIKGVVLVLESTWPHRRKRIAFQIDIPMKPTRLFAFMRKYNPQVALFTTCFFGMIVLILYGIYEIVWRPWRLKMKNTSFPSRRNKSEVPNLAEIHRIYHESNRKKSSEIHGAYEEIVTTNSTDDEIDCMESEEEAAQTPEPVDAEEIQRIFNEARGGE